LRVISRYLGWLSNLSTKFYFVCTTFVIYMNVRRMIENKGENESSNMHSES